MENDQTPDPGKDNQTVVEPTAKGGTVLTGEPENKSVTPPLAGDATPDLPHAWMTGLTTEQKADVDLVKSLSRFEKGIPDLAKSYVELEQKAGQSVVLPNEKATPEEWAKFYGLMGRPEKPEDYKLAKVELPEGLAADEAMEQDFLKLAHAKGLNDDTVNAIRSWYMAEMGKQIVDAQKIVKISKADSDTAMRERYGSGFESAQAYMERGFQQFATPALSNLFRSSGMGNHEDVIGMFVKIGKLISEHPFVDGGKGEHIETAAVGNRTDEEIANLLYPSKE